MKYLNIYKYMILTLIFFLLFSSFSPVNICVKIGKTELVHLKDYSVDNVQNNGCVNNPEPPPNIPPVANASAGEPYIGFVNEEIMFNGSYSYDPDGYIVNYIWKSNNEVIGYGKITNIAFSNSGTFEIILNVTDDDGATDEDTVIVKIFKPNHPPLKPIITGSVYGLIDSDNNFSIVSDDFDNDDLFYHIDWGDGHIEEWVGPFKSGEVIIISHSWSNNDKYTIKVIAKDSNGTTSPTATHNIFIIKNKEIFPNILNNIQYKLYQFSFLRKIIKL